MSPPPAEQFAARIFIGPALRAQPDRRLVDLVRDGYDAAFEEIVRRYRKPLDRFAAGIVGGRSEDVTQDSFAKALLALRGSEAEIELRPWLYRIVRNTALNDLRDRAPVAEELSERLPGARSTAAEVEAREELQDLMQRLQALPEPQRAALVMRELEGLSHEEIAAALGLSGGAARQAIYRARAALREGFGLLLPLPVLRMLAERGGEVGAAGGTVAAGGALKAGMATMLIAGAVGAGVAIDHDRGERPGPEAAEAAPLVTGRHPGAGVRQASGESDSHGQTDARGSGSGGQGRGSSGGPGGGHSHGNGSLGGSSGGPGPSRGGSHSGEGSEHSGSGEDGSHHSGSGTPGSDDSGSGSGDRHDGTSGSGDLSGSSGSGSDDGGGTSGGSSSDDSFSSSGDGGGSDSSGETITEPTGEHTLDESGYDGGTSEGSVAGTSGSGSGDLTTSTSSSDGGS